VFAGAQAMNEVHLHRGRHPHMGIIDTYVDGQHLTEAVVRASPSSTSLPGSEHHRLT
jgi:hypothetical protein